MSENNVEATNFARATRVIAHLEGIYRDLASASIDPLKVVAHRSWKLSAVQTDVVKNIPLVKHYNNCEFDLLYIIIRHLCGSTARPTNGWGRQPSPTATNPFDDMERVREMKQKHVSENAGYRTSTEDYDVLLEKAEEICHRFDCNDNYKLRDTYKKELYELKTWSTTDVSEEPVSSKILDYIADRIAGEWKRLGRLLDMEEHKIEQIDNDYDKIYEKAIQCLRTWQQAHGKKALWKELKQSLSDIQRQDIIDEVEDKFIFKGTTSANYITFFSKHKFTIDILMRLDCSEDNLKNPKVYHCTMFDGPLEIPVAVKLFNVDSDEHCHELKENAKILFELRKDPQCHNVVNIIDFKEHSDGKFFLVIEKGNFDLSQYLGISVVNRDFMKEEIKKTKERIISKDIARGILNGLEFVHSNRQGGTVMHRDIKPANILFKVDERNVTLKISDFGISKKSIFSRSTTTTNLNKGTDLYIPPDIRKKRDLNERTIEIIDLQMADMFAFGVTLYQVLTGGKHPFQGKNELRTSINIEDGIRDELLKLSDKTVLNLIYNLTEENPKDRMSALEVKKHPWLFNSDDVLELLKQLNITLFDKTVCFKQKMSFEEDRKYAFECKRWDTFLPGNFFEELNAIESASYTMVYNDFVRDFIKFVLKVIAISSETDYKGGMLDLFGCQRPSNKVILNHLLIGTDPIFPSAFIYIYCKAAEVFPHLDIFKIKDSTAANKKLFSSYKRYLEHASSDEICTLRRLRLDLDLNKLSLEAAEERYDGESCKD